MIENLTDNQIKLRELELKELEVKSNRLISIVKIITTGVVVTLIPAIINGQIQRQEIEIKRLEGEVVYLEKFSDNVVEQDDLTKRKNFVEYLATIAHSEGSRERWNTYLKIVEGLAKEQEKIDQAISIAVQKAESSQRELEVIEKKYNLAIRENDKSVEELKEKLKETQLQVQNAKVELIKKSDEREQLIQKSSLADTDFRLSDYQVGLQTVGVADTERLSINEKLEKKGYSLDSITYSYDTGNKPSWFANKPTVFYYSASSRGVAEKLASLIESYTKTKFVVQRGAGLGVEENKRKVTFFIHYIK